MPWLAGVLEGIGGAAASGAGAAATGLGASGIGSALSSVGTGLSAAASGTPTSALGGAIPAGISFAGPSTAPSIGEAAMGISNAQTPLQGFMGQAGNFFGQQALGQIGKSNPMPPLPQGQQQKSQRLMFDRNGFLVSY